MFTVSCSHHRVVAKVKERKPFCKMLDNYVEVCHLLVYYMTERIIICSQGDFFLSDNKVSNVQSFVHIRWITFPANLCWKCKIAKNKIKLNNGVSTFIFVFLTEIEICYWHVPEAMSYIMTQTYQSPFLALAHSTLHLSPHYLNDFNQLIRATQFLFIAIKQLGWLQTEGLRLSIDCKSQMICLQCFTDQRPADSSVCGWCSRLALSYMCGQHGELCSQAEISETVPILNAVLPEASSLHTKIEPSNDLIDYRSRFKFHILCWGKLWNCSSL